MITSENLGTARGKKQGSSAILDESRFATKAPRRLLDGLLEVAILATEASEGSIVLMTKDRELVTVGLAGGPKKSLLRAAQSQVSGSIAAWVANHRESLLLIGPARDPRFAGLDREIKDAICVPLILNGQVLGVLSVSNKKGARNFDQVDMEKLTALAEASALIIASTVIQVDQVRARYVSERNRLAQEIHDGLIQDLTAVILQLEVCEKFIAKTPQKATSQVGKIKEQAKASLQGLRRLVFNLRAADVEEVGLTQMVQGYIAEFEKEADFAIAFKVAGQEREISPEVKGHLLAIVQESLTNVSKHAEAKQATVDLRYSPREVEITIADDGCGFGLEEAMQRAWAEKKFGLMGMQERAHILGGSLDIDSRPGRGTIIRFRLPLSMIVQRAQFAAAGDDDEDEKRWNRYAF